MNDKKKHWLWNVLLVLTVTVCVFALAIHYKNWINVDTDHVNVRSGFYSVKVEFNQLDSVVFVARLPPMQRLNGFSALEKEKGIFREFKDSLTDKKVYVFVDNISQQKIKLVYRDSARLYLNLKDSVETLRLFAKLTPRTDKEDGRPN